MEKYQLAPYVQTPKEAYETILDLGELKPGEVFCDIGAGILDLVIRACKSPYNTKSVGIELRKDLVAIAKERVKKERLGDMIEIINDDFLNPGIDISDASLVYIYLSNEGNARVRYKLEKQLRDEARVISNNFFMPKWIYSDCKVVRAPIIFAGITSPPIQHYFYLYRMSDVRR